MCAMNLFLSISEKRANRGCANCANVAFRLGRTMAPVLGMIHMKDKTRDGDELDEVDAGDAAQGNVGIWRQ